MNEKLKKIITKIIIDGYYNPPDQARIVANLTKFHADLVINLDAAELGSLIVEVSDSIDFSYLKFKRYIHAKFFNSWADNEWVPKKDMEDVLALVTEKAIDRARFVEDIFKFLEYYRFVYARQNKFPTERNETSLIIEDWKVFSEYDKGGLDEYPDSAQETIQSVSEENSWINTDQTLVEASEIPEEKKEQVGEARKVWGDFTHAKILVISVASIAVISIMCYVVYFKHEWTVKKATNFYVASVSIDLHSSENDETYNVVKKLPYGTGLAVIKRDSLWCEAEVDGRHGFVDAKAILVRADFVLLNSIFADEESKSAISDIKYRIALLEYFREKKYIGKLERPTQDSFFRNYQLNKQGWQVSVFNVKNVPNNIYISEIEDSNSKLRVFGVLIKNLVTRDRKLLLFNIDNNDSANVIAEQEAPMWGGIVSISRSVRSGKPNYRAIYSSIGKK